MFKIFKKKLKECNSCYRIRKTYLKKTTKYSLQYLDNNKCTKYSHKCSRNHVYNIQPPFTF